MKTKILRKQQWSGNALTAYEIRRTARYINLACLTRETGSYDIVYRLPLMAEDELLNAYDNGTIIEWIFNNIGEWSTIVSKTKVC